MDPTPLALQGSTVGTAVTVGRTLAFAALGLAAALLGFYLTVFVKEVLVPPYEDRWWYLGVGVAAAVVYGVAGVVEVVGAVEAAATFRVGATLFFFLFSAAGVRALYVSVRRGDGRMDAGAVPGWIWYPVIGGFVVGWWAGYLVGDEPLTALLTTVGLAGAVTYTLVFAVLTVRDAEGTSIAAVVRQFVPGLVAFAAVVVAEQAGQYAVVDPGVVIGIELVGTALVGAFLFTTAVTIHHQRGEVERIYDRTTWRDQALADSPEDRD